MLIIVLIIGALFAIMLSVWSCIYSNNSISRKENEEEFREFCNKFRNNSL